MNKWYLDMFNFEVRLILSYLEVIRALIIIVDKVWI